LVKQNKVGLASPSETDILLSRMRRAADKNHGMMLEPFSLKRLLATIDMLVLELWKMREEEKNEVNDSRRISDPSDSAR